MLALYESHCILAHACLAAYMNFVRRNLSSTCITGCDVTVVEPISVQRGGF